MQAHICVYMGVRKLTSSTLVLGAVIYITYIGLPLFGESLDDGNSAAIAAIDVIKGTIGLAVFIGIAFALHGYAFLRKNHHCPNCGGDRNPGVFETVECGCGHTHSWKDRFNHPCPRH
jgi:hypothetical protein